MSSNILSADHVPWFYAKSCFVRVGFALFNSGYLFFNTRCIEIHLQCLTLVPRGCYNKCLR